MDSLNRALLRVLAPLRARHGRWVELLLALVAFSAFFALYFSPVWLRGAFLAPGDAAVEYMPLYYKSWHIWTDLLLTGYPAMADLQFQTNYLPKLLIPTYNAFVISAYVIMAVGTYFFVSAYTLSRLGAIIAAIITSSGGFMIAHLGHATIIHAACWMPWIFWSLNRVRYGPSTMARIVGAFSVGLSLLGGHPQVSIIIYLAAAAFWLFLFIESTVRNQWKDMGMAGLQIFGLGLLLSAISVIPFVEFTMQGVRAAWSLKDFNSFSETPRSLLLALFPNLFGTHPATVFGAYRGPWNLTELAFYAGTGGLFLAVMGFWLAPRRAHAWFWATLATLALLMSMAANTPFGDLVFKLPVLGQFRAHARFGLVYIFCCAVLVAMLFAVPAPEGCDERLRQRWRMTAGAIGWLIIAAAGAYGLHAVLGSPAVPSSEAPGFRLAVAIPAASCTCTVAAWLAWHKRRSTTVGASIVLLIALDLASFGMFYEWRFNTVDKRLVHIDASGELLLQAMQKSGGRVLPVLADKMPFGPFRPDSSVLWHVPIATSYGPLLPERMQTFAAVDNSGNPHFDVSGSPLLDVMGVGWLATPSYDDLPSFLTVSRQCGIDSAARTLAEFVVPRGVRASSLRIVSQLSCSTAIPDGVPVVDLMWHGSNASGNISLVAGKDTAEWAYDMPSTGAVAHRRATIAWSYDSGGRVAHTYVTEKRFPEGDAIALDDLKVKLEWPGVVGVKIIRMDVIGPDSSIVTLSPKIGDGEWVGLDNRGLVSRRASPAPSAWGTCDARAMSKEELKRVLQRGEFRSGEKLLVHATALFDESTALPSVGCSSPPIVKSIQRKEGGRIDIDFSASQPGLVVVSNTYYPGWVAKVEGSTLPILPVDGFIQAIEVPAGSHKLKLRYRPTSIMIGAALSLLALFALLLPPLLHGRRWRPQPRLHV